MKITFEAPRESEVQSVEVDGERNKLTVEPRFRKRSRIAPALYIRVEGAGGRVQHLRLVISATTGECRVERPQEQPVVPEFDKLKAGDPIPRPEKKK